MDNSIFLARLVGPYCLIAALAFLINRDDYKKVIEGMVNNTAVRCLAAMLGLIIGLLIVNTHNLWVEDWPVLITLIGWISLVKGATLFVLPKSFIKFARDCHRNRIIIIGQLNLTLLAGIYLTYKGYS